MLASLYMTYSHFLILNNHIPLTPYSLFFIIILNSLFILNSSIHSINYSIITSNITFSYYPTTHHLTHSIISLLSLITIISHSTSIITLSLTTTTTLTYISHYSYSYSHIIHS